MPKLELDFSRPVLNAAGTLGFAPDRHGLLNLAELGAFVTDPVSLRPRQPAQGTRYLPYPGGFLLHTGHPNPGIKTAVREFAAQWGRSPLTVIVHLLPRDPDETREMVHLLESVEGVSALEVGLPPGAPGDAAEFARAAVGELPVILRLPFEQAIDTAATLAESGIAALSLAPPRGAFPTAGGEIVRGRLYGPGLFPLALLTVARLAQGRLPVIASGGVYTLQDVDAMLAVGALAVQVDAVLWRDASVPSRSSLDRH